MIEPMKITVVGLGYVGLSNAILLAQQHDVIALDIDASRVAAINDRRSPIEDSDVQHFLSHRPLNLRATTVASEAYRDADFVIVATPTDYDVVSGQFDTLSVDSTIRDAIRHHPQANLVIKSTVPIGYTARLRNESGHSRIFFSPEFLREGRALHDNLHPSRIVVGDHSEPAQTFAKMLKACAIRSDVPILHTGSDEAEAIKLFANTYLAMRVAYFNELDTFAAHQGLNARQIIDGVSLDPRVGAHYNNPSFGYGGYCLPKDTQQLLANFEDIPQDLIRAVVNSNETRRAFIAQDILSRKPQVVGIHRLIMKAHSDNFRASSIIGVISHLLDQKVQVLIYEPQLTSDVYLGCEVIPDFEEFCRRSDVVVANRKDPDLEVIGHKIYTRDLFGIN